MVGLGVAREVAEDGALRDSRGVGHLRDGQPLVVPGPRCSLVIEHTDSIVTSASSVNTGGQKCLYR